MGTVLEAFDRTLDRRVAVKVLHGELRPRARPRADLLMVRKCGGGCLPSMVGPLEPSETLRQAPLEAGSYVVEIEWPQGQELEVDLEFLGPCG